MHANTLPTKTVNIIVPAKHQHVSMQTVAFSSKQNTSANLEGAGSTTCTAACHQGAIDVCSLWCCRCDDQQLTVRFSHLLLKRRKCTKNAEWEELKEAERLVWLQRWRTFRTFSSLRASLSTPQALVFLLMSNLLMCEFVVLSSVELPQRHDHQEGGSCSGRRLHGGGQTRRGHAAVGARPG